MSKLQELKKYTQNLTVLYVEDNPHLLKQVSIFLKKLFKNVYVATDGIDGIKSYREYKQDIIMTDLTMPNMNGYEMIKALKKIENQLKIIIISAHSDTDNLLEALHIGVCDFIPKPIDNELFQNVLFKVAKSTSPNLIDNKTEILSDGILEQLSKINRESDTIEFINHYKGVPIIHQGYIIDIKDDSIIVYVPYIQTLAIAYESSTVMESNKLNGSINTTLTSIDPQTREVTLSNFHKMEQSAKHRKNIRVEADDKITLVPYVNDLKFDAKVKNISMDSILFETDLHNIDNITEGQLIKLSFSITLSIEEKISKISKNEIIYATGTIFKIDKFKTKVNIIVIFTLNQVGKNILQRYINHREIELIEEFKLLKKRYIF